MARDMWRRSFPPFVGRDYCKDSCISENRFRKTMEFFRNLLARMRLRCVG